MKILILSNIELDETNAAGNTFANWLTGWDDAEISSLYCRSSIPQNGFCDSFYCVPPIDIIKNLVTPWRIGRFYRKENLLQKRNLKNNIEDKIIKKTKTGNLDFLHIIEDIVINFKLWQNRKYKKYIQDFNPDIVFCFAKAEAFLYQNLKYIKHHTNAKIVLFFADDMYSIYKGSGLKNLIFRHRFPKIAKIGDLNYGASVLMCQEYSETFGISLSPLYKGCNIFECKKEINNPIKIVYAGNLYYGREMTLSKIAKALEKINSGKTIASLEIYTGAVITEKIGNMLNIEGSSRIMGKRPYSEIQTILKNADIVLHVESFNPKDIQIVRLSYSTKISDCLQSGATMLVVGPRGIASVEEALLIDGAKVISEEQSIEKELMELISNPSLLLARAKKTKSFAVNKFSLYVTRKNLYNEFQKLIIL